METRQSWVANAGEKEKITPVVVVADKAISQQVVQRRLVYATTSVSSVAPKQTGVPLWALGISAAAGTALAIIVIPIWVPILGASLVGTDAKAYWYLSRASGIAAFLLLWVSMASGLLISNKMARTWPGGFAAFDLHQFSSLLALGFTLFHAFILLGNHYIEYNLAQLLVPFAGSSYRPNWTGIGQVALYLSVLVSFTFYVRRQIGYRMWRLIHFLSYALFLMALVHGIYSGTDSSSVWVSWMYWLTGTSLIALNINRIVAHWRTNEIA